MPRKPIWTAADQRRAPKRLVLRELREAAGLTLEQVAGAIRRSSAQYSRLELNPHLIRQQDLVRLAALFSVDANVLAATEAAVDAPSHAAMRRVVPVYELRGDTMEQIAVMPPHFEVSLNTYAIVVPDDKMAAGSPRLERGEWAIFDPSIQPKPGGIVHAIDPMTGQHVIRSYAPLHPSNSRAPGFVLRASDPATDEIYVPAAQSGAIRGTLVGKQVRY